MRFRSTMAVAGLFAASLAAHADTFQAYSVGASLYDILPFSDGTYSFTMKGISGTAIYDVDTGSFTSVTLPIDGPEPETTMTFEFETSPYSGPQCSGYSYACLQFIPEIPNDFYFQYADQTQPIYQPNGDFQLQEQYGLGQVGDPITITPEPSSFALLGTGLLGVAGVMKRRFA